MSRKPPVDAEHVGNDLPTGDEEDVLERGLQRRYTRIADEVNQLDDRVRLDTARLRVLRPLLAEVAENMRRLGIELPKVPKVSEVTGAGTLESAPRPQRTSEFLKGIRRGITLGRSRG